MKAQAHHGTVILLGELTRPLTREQAADLLCSIASAVHLSGDISDPRGVNLAEAVRKAVEDFQRGPKV